MSTVDIIRALAATNSRTDKEQILLDAWMNGERDLFKGGQLAYDILMPFNVKKVAEIESEDGDLFEPTFTFQNFLDLANKLHTRQITGNAARDAIHAAAGSCDAVVWNEFYRRVLLKDLRAGVTDTTFNKVLGKLAKSDSTANDYLVPVFSCQLAKDGADEANAKKVAGVKMLDIKLDGVRLLTFVDKEARTVTQYTRNGKVNDNFTHIRGIFEAIMDELPCSMVFDGEITGKNFQELMTQVNRSEKVATEDTKLALFDMLPVADFKAGRCKMPQKDRHTAMVGFFNSSQAIMGTLQYGKAVYVVPKLTVDLRTPEGQKAFKEFNREAVEAGYEGIMVKDPEAPYETKRTFAWLKIKPFIEISLKIVGWEEGTGKNVGKLGAWIMEGTDDDKFIRTNCGGGFSDKEREEFWRDREKYMGFIGEVRCDVLTLERNSTDVWSARFPRWKGFRGTEPGEKL